MKIKCKFNLGKHLPRECQVGGIGRSTLFPLEKGKEYTVYGLVINNGYFWYYICDDEYDEEKINYPIWYPAPLFEIINKNLSKYWRICFNQEKLFNNVVQLIAFEEWINDAYYYDRLTDGKREEVEIFKKYKSLMDNEFCL